MLRIYCVLTFIFLPRRVSRRGLVAYGAHLLFIKFHKIPVFLYLIIPLFTADIKTGRTIWILQDIICQIPLSFPDESLPQFSGVFFGVTGETRRGRRGQKSIAGIPAVLIIFKDSLLVSLPAGTKKFSNLTA